MLCNGCEVVNINGIPCHETGCPYAHINPYTKKPYLKECKWCGSEFQPEDQEDFCSVECRSYF